MRETPSSISGRSVCDTATAGSMKIDTSQKKIILSQNAKVILGLTGTTSEISFDLLRSLIHSPHQYLFHTLILKAEQRSLPAEAEMKIYPQGHQSFKLIKLFFDITDWDETSEVTGVVTDVTIQKEVQEQIRKSRELLNATINSSLDIIQVFEAVRNQEGEIVDFTWVLNNETSERMYGDVIGKSLLKNNPGVVEEGIFETFKKVVETGIPDQSERYYVHEQFNGWFYQSTVKLNDGVTTTTRDITERKIAEQAILGLKDEIAQRAEEAVKVQLSNYQRVNTELREARKAALNLVEDVIQSKEALKVSEEQLKQLNASLEQQVTERTAELKASKDLLQSIFDTTLIGICLHEAVYDENGDIIDFRIKLVNKELERLTAEKDLAGKLYTQQYPGIRKTPVFETMIRVMRTGQPSQLEYVYEHDGFEKWFSSMFVKLGNNIIATILDISERKKHEEDIFKNLSILQQSEEIILMGSWEYDIKNRKLSLSNGMLKLFDLDYGEETSPDLYIAKATKETRSAAQRIVKKITSEYEPFEELVQLKHDGGAKVIKVKATVIRDEEGKALKMVGVDIDITNESRSQEIMRMMTESLFEVDNNWRVIFINAAALNFFSIEREKIEGHGLWNVFPEMTGTAFHRSLLHAMQDKKSFRKEFYSNRTHRWIYASVTPSARGVIVLFTDIQAQKNAAERLKESEQRLRSVVENTPDIITRWDKDRKLIFANHAFEDKTGMPILQALGKTNEEMGQPDHIAEPYMHKLDVVLHTALSTEHFNYFPSPVGERYYYSRMVPEFDTDGRVQSVLAIARDITDLKKVQEELLDKNKRLIESQQSLERKDNFIRIASHELKTPITSLQGYAQLLLDAYEDEEKDPFLAEGLTVINRQVSKLTKLINDLLDITRVDTGSMRLDIHSFDLCEMIQETITFMKPTTTHELNFTGLDCQQVIGDKERINQVFLNLLTNAIKYSPNADKVEIHVEADDDFVTVAVKDYGIGIANQFHDKIFDRFYRVQGSNEQTFSGFGIGLYIATEIVKRHHGKIWVDSSENEGSTFYFSLPLKKD